jgi:hypothetical protein
MLPTSTYPMWYNVIPPFVPLDPNLYLAYPTGTKGFEYLIFKIIQVKYLGMCTQYLNKLLYH